MQGETNSGTRWNGGKDKETTREATHLYELLGLHPYPLSPRPSRTSGAGRALPALEGPPWPHLPPADQTAQQTARCKNDSVPGRYALAPLKGALRSLLAGHAVRAARVRC